MITLQHDVAEIYITPETDRERARRRYMLCALDGLLGYAEYHNLRYGRYWPIPTRLWRLYRYRGGILSYEELNSDPEPGRRFHEEILEMQDRYVLQVRVITKRQPSLHPRRRLRRAG